MKRMFVYLLLCLSLSFAGFVACNDDGDDSPCTTCGDEDGDAEDSGDDLESIDDELPEGACLRSSQCGDTEVCVEGECEAEAYDRPYTITINNGSVEDRVYPSWDPWDEDDNSYADIYVALEIDGVEVYRTTTKLNALKPLWRESTEQTLTATQNVRFIIYDEDEGDDQVIYTITMGTEGGPVPMQYLHNGGFNFNDGDKKVSLTVKMDALPR